MIARKLVVVLTTLLLSSCIRSPVIDQTYYDYFPYQTGKTWTYLKNGNDTVDITIVGDTLISEDTLLIFESSDGTRTYLFPTTSAFFTLEDTSVVGPDGEEIKLEDGIFFLYLEKPLVTGNSWEDHYFNRVVVAEDTFWIRHSRLGQVSGLETVSVPAGTFDDVYRVRIVEDLVIGTSDGLSERSYMKSVYYAPERGPVKQLITVYRYDSTSSSVSDTTFSVTLELIR